MTYTPPPFPTGLKPWGFKPSAEPLQRVLKDAGYMARNVGWSKVYGPRTQAAVKSFHKANPKFGKGTDGAIGPMGWAHLHREAYAPKSNEPPHDYARTTMTGKVVNQRTKLMLLRAEVKWGGAVTITQGSYNAGGVAASAGTHDGGGVVDISVLGFTSARRLALVRALREVGFAAWLRTPAEGFTFHIHAVAIGDRELSSGAKKQVTAYFAGRNGLADGGPDTAPESVGRPMPEWAEQYRKG